MVTRHYLQAKRYHGNLGSFERKKRTREAFERGVYEYHAGNFMSAAKRLV
jgi:hypothetical protein